MNAQPWASKEVYEMIKNIHEIVEDNKQLLEKVAAAQISMAESAKLIASVHDRIEKRYELLEDRLQEANDRAAGKDQIPMKSHFVTLCGTVLLFILIFVVATEYTIDASLSSFKFNKAHTKTEP